MESKLVSRFYQNFWLYLIGIILLIITIAITIILKNKIMVKNKVGFFSIIIITMAFIIFFLIKFIPYSRDLNSVKNKTFETITGEVVDYGKAKAIGDIATEVKYYYPIIEDKNGIRIKLDVNGTVKNNTYTFIYLEHTKLAEILN